jgi:hypothetical protein
VGDPRNIREFFFFSSSHQIMTSETLDQQPSTTTADIKGKAAASTDADQYETISTDGQLKKRVLKAGYGERPPVGSQVFGTSYFIHLFHSSNLYSALRWYFTIGREIRLQSRS